MSIILPKPVLVNKSPIFSTYKNDIMGAEGNLELFGKSINKIFDDLKSNKGLFNSLFTNAITENDVIAINEYANALSKGTAPATAWKDTMTDCSWAAQKTAASCGTSAESLKTLAATTVTTTSVTKTATIALKTLASTALNMIAFALIAQGISLVVKGLDNLLHATEKCRERVDELMG